MQFDNIISVQKELSELMVKTISLKSLLERAMLLEEVVKGKSYINIDLSLNGMDNNLILDKRIKLSHADSISMMEQLSIDTDYEITMLRKALEL